MIWRVCTLLGIALSAGVGGAWLLHPTTTTFVGGVALGMSEIKAFRRLQALDPLADLGGYCGNDDGILAYVDTMDRTWQVMAHLKRKTVNEVQLQWSGFDTTPDLPSCQAAFETEVLPRLRSHFDLSPFDPVAKGETGYAEIHQARVVQTGISVTAIVQRRAVAGAACNVTVVVSEDGAEPYFRVQVLPQERANGSPAT